MAEQCGGEKEEEAVLLLVEGEVVVVVKERLWKLALQKAKEEVGRRKRGEENKKLVYNKRTLDYYGVKYAFE